MSTPAKGTGNYRRKKSRYINQPGAGQIYQKHFVTHSMQAFEKSSKTRETQGWQNGRSLKKPPIEAFPFSSET